MAMNSPKSSELRGHLASLFSAALGQVAPGHAATVVAVERPKQAGHGDFACNLAMQLAKPLKRNPREIAQALVQALPASPVVDKAEVAGAGFINLSLKPAARQRVVRDVLEAGARFGEGTYGWGRKVQVESVSANAQADIFGG